MTTTLCIASFIINAIMFQCGVLEASTARDLTVMSSVFYIAIGIDRILKEKL